jgi:hypothetical protein
MPLTSSRKPEIWLCYILPGTSKVSDATTTDTSAGATSTSVTWCYVKTRTPRDGTSSCPHGEGPYIIAEVLKLGTYKLSNEKGEILTNAWNIEQLRRFFP